VTSSFKITVGGRWLARDFGDEITRATLGQLEIFAGGRLLTRVEDRSAGSVRGFANLSAYELASWLAVNWWRLRWEPERLGTDWSMCHGLTAVGGGYVWPNITVLSDGEQVTIQMQPTAGAKWEPIRYLEHWKALVPVDEFEAGIDAFVEEVIARLAACRIPDTDLSAMWRELRSERADPELSSLRKLEALAGYDAGEAPEAMMARLRARAATDGADAIDEIAAGFGNEAVPALEKIDRVLEANGIELSGGAPAELAKAREGWRAPQAPHERAAEAAHVARQLWKVDCAAPIPDKTLLDIVGAGPALLSEPGDTPIAAARRGESERAPWRLLLRSRHHEGRRFELCRLIADAAAARAGERLLPATNAKTSRQKFQRAFAQEFLCPIQALVAWLGTSHPEDEELEAAARYFQVSPLLVRTALVDNGTLPRDPLAL
jgi:hypothetical protein